MSMRIYSAVALILLLTACENRPDNAVLAEAEQRAAAQAGDDGKISCAIDGASDFTRDCLVERLSGENGVTMIIRHPDGGFRRFNVLTDGHGLEAADGFDKARISIVEDGKIQVSVGPDKYLLPAQIKPDAGAQGSSASQEDPATAGN
ncbi:lipoprotein [Sphingorhabdus sp. SMR4y]|nr:lipoprotein [Sphingorhabdus sp. SMR4y]